ncbi:hypothetical protein BS78_K155600 [Paspalum vaginatum]|uniref:Uncharacterized protein n=1 Tax=Paspalum vaginatum TaxID=158149 RepID=A0A9W7XET3_9POAL|nr:hypothetical protein BS78_K155600 [Paspalum vaginatum]
MPPRLALPLDCAAAFLLCAHDTAGCPPSRALNRPALRPGTSPRGSDLARRSATAPSREQRPRPRPRCPVLAAAPTSTAGSRPRARAPTGGPRPRARPRGVPASTGGLPRATATCAADSSARVPHALAPLVRRHSPLPALTLLHLSVRRSPPLSITSTSEREWCQLGSLPCRSGHEERHLHPEPAARPCLCYTLPPLPSSGTTLFACVKKRALFTSLAPLIPHLLLLFSARLRSGSKIKSAADAL